LSLRARLLIGLVALGAVGLLVFGAVTYAEQRSFLYQRVDQQAVAAVDVVRVKLDAAGANVPGYSPPGTGRDGDHGGGPRPYGEEFGGPLPRGAAPPPGTFAERRDGSGRVLSPAVRTTAYGETARPKLPAKIPLTVSPQNPKAITVGSVGSSLRYRVISVPTGDQPGTTVVAVPQREVDQTLHRLLRVEALVAAGVLAALAALAWSLVRVGLRPLDRMGETAGAIAAGDLSRRVSPATPKTEVGRLGIALNSMLGQIERAFADRQASEDRLRRFLADASHELRTPLSSIRGYAELFRIGAAASPEETAKAMRRIEDEAARMGVLVEDLLTLARLDEVRASVREPVDLAAVAGDAVDDARATAPDRAVDLVSDGPVTVIGDRDQLRQVVANLVRNALVHTPAGTPIELAVARGEDGATLTVRDHGPGLPTEDGGALFERFWRSEPGRGRGRAGAGLGLAIVAAIVDAHDGAVDAANAPGGGACFTIRLPLAPAASPTAAPRA
jgi:two-component system, OmpR family, sensor kinase